MTIPAFEQIMPVILEMATEVDQIEIRYCMDDAANQFNLSEEEREKTLPSGKQKEPYKQDVLSVIRST
jgi:restriction endonuclease Mrr